MLGRVQEIEVAIRFLDLFAYPVATRPTNSYVLKHTIERGSGEYVSNGATIAAALLLGHRVTRPRPESPNAVISSATKTSCSLLLLTPHSNDFSPDAPDDLMERVPNVINS